MAAPALIVAAMSARMLAESARRAGLRPIALDVFGDVDTRRTARWVGIGNSAGSGIDAQRLHAVIARLGRHPQVCGWVAGAGFEDRLDLLQDCARTLKLIGNDPATIAAAKQPSEFFGMLDRCGIDHPETSLVAPAVTAGWLAKRVGGTGGWHVRRCAPDRAHTEPLLARYYQREEAGAAMSVLFLANGADVLPIGCNRLLAGAMGERPFVFQGAVGPVALPAAAAKAVRHAVSCVARHLALQGLNSLDFLLDGERASVIEINPRPSATMQLHDDRLQGGLLKAHVAACVDRTLPPEAAVRPSPVRGIRIIYARRPLTTSLRGCRWLQALGWCHDIGREGTHVGRGDPLCTVSAQGESSAAVESDLVRRADQIQSFYEEDHDR